MPQVINTNVMSLNAQRNLNRSGESMATTLMRLSSGLRINRAKDDAAGLAISERFTAQIRGLNQAARNASDGISMMQTAEGAMQEIANNLQRMRELAVQAANATNSAQDRNSLNQEVFALQEEVMRVIDGTDFNGVKVLFSATAFGFQVGANAPSATNRITVNLSNLASVAAIATAISGNVTSVLGALSAIDRFDVAINEISARRAAFGAIQNRFDSVVRNLQNVSENLQASRSRILDADFASETAELTRSQILQNAGMSMLAQANQLPNNVLQLVQ